VLAPAQELVALPVALVLQVHVALEGVRPAEHVRDHRVVDHQLGGGQRVDPGGVAAERTHRLPHGGEIHHARHAREVLHDHPRRRELDLGGRLGVRIPAGQRPHVIRRHVHAVLGAQQVLQQDLQAVRQRVGAAHARQPEDLVRAGAHGQPAAGAEGVDAGLARR
jgi:hypothetical protein